MLGTLGWAQYKNRRMDEAADTLGRATHMLPQDAMKHYMLGVVAFHRSDHAGARRELTAALEANAEFPRAGDARNLLAQLGE